jgi:hypothetical protein
MDCCTSAHDVLDGLKRAIQHPDTVQLLRVIKHPSGATMMFS